MPEPLNHDDCTQLADLIQRGITTNTLTESRTQVFLWPNHFGGYRGHVLAYAAVGALGSPEEVLTEIKRLGSWLIVCDRATGVPRCVQDLAYVAFMSGVPIRQVEHLLRTDPDKLLTREAPCRAEWQGVPLS